MTALSATTTANAMVQMRSDPSMRGRVMALYMALFVGGKPIGGPIIGVIGDALGARWTVGVGAIAVGATLALVSFWLARHENVEVSYSSQRRPHLQIVSAPAPAPAPVPDVPEVVR